jgi:hypothetical protein
MMISALWTTITIQIQYEAKMTNEVFVKSGWPKIIVLSRASFVHMFLPCACPFVMLANPP